MPNPFLPLRDIRKAAGLSKIELAKRAGISRSTMYLLEDGLMDARVSTLKKVAHALRVKPERLLADDEAIKSSILPGRCGPHRHPD